MSGGLFLKALDRELGTSLTEAQADRLRQAQRFGFARPAGSDPSPARRARAAGRLVSLHVPWAIATSGASITARRPLAYSGFRKHSGRHPRPGRPTRSPTPISSWRARAPGRPAGRLLRDRRQHLDLLAAQRAAP